jgi:FkbM family methyltransferase
MIATLVRLLGLRRRMPEAVVRSWRGMEFELDPRTDIGGAMLRSGTFEAAEIDVATALFASRYSRQSERLILDVGANIGIHALLWAHALPHSRVVALEPAPMTYRVLLRNIERNGQTDRIGAIQVAASNRDAELDFFVTEDNAYNSLKDTRRKAVREIIKVPARRLDALAELEGARVGMIKIDVEGLESTVIAGARGLIQRDAPILFVEIYRGVASNSDPEGTIAAATELGYDAYVYSAASGLVEYESHDDRRYNYFFLPRRRAAD